MTWRSIIPDDAGIQPKTDRKTAVSFGSFRISDQAVYLSGREYLPLRAVRRAQLYRSRLSTHGCCGLGVPVWYVLLYYGADKPLKLLTESKDRAEAVLAAVLDRNPEIETADG